MTPIRSLVRITAIAVGAIYTLALFASGVELDTWLKRALGFVPFLAVALAMAFDLWVWKWPLVHRLLGRPLIRGTWKGTLAPHPDSHIPAGGNRGPIEAYIVVEQTYWTLAVTLFTEQSASRSRTSRFIARPESKAQLLTFAYENVPRPEHRMRSPRHIGACELSIEERVPETLAGEYFSDRFTAGEMKLELCDRTSGHADFEAAKAHCS